MSKVKGGGASKGGGGKTRGGGGTIAIKKTKARHTKEIDENIVILREAIFETDGKDKDVTKGIAPAFLKYDRNGLDCKISFQTKLDSSTLDWAFNLVKEHMEEVYDSSGYGTYNLHPRCILLKFVICVITK